MKLNPISRKNEMWFGSESTYKERTDAIHLANITGTNYDLIKSLQQSLPSRMEKIQTHITRYTNCKDCRLGDCPFVINKVFFRGYLPCDVLFVGDAPGKTEDTHGIPFIGEAGNVLDTLIKDVSQRLYNKDNGFRWCITNAVMCLPYDQGDFRKPEKDEIKACSPKLKEFIDIANPKLIVQLGMIAQNAMKLLDWKGKQTYIPHPSWMLRQNSECDLEIKRAVLSLVPIIKEILNA